MTIWIAQNQNLISCNNHMETSLSNLRLQHIKRADNF